MNIIKEKKIGLDNKLFLLIFAISFTVFIFTSDAHRYTIDEDSAHQQTMRIVTQEPDPRYVQGESRMLFVYPDIFTNPSGPICQNAILCYPTPIGHTVTQVPFVFVNHNLNIITKDTVVWTSEDFDDPHYVWWRNNMNPDFTFLELFYGPFFSSMSVGVFFLICRTFNFEQKNSIMLALFYGLTTIVWAYSKTSLNVVPGSFFILLGFLFFRKFQKTDSIFSLILCASSLGFAFLVRMDAALFIISIFLFLLYNLRTQNKKIKKFFSFVIPSAFFYIVYTTIDFIRIGTSPISGVTSSASVVTTIGTGSTPIAEGVFGLLLSPGVGLLIFAPILFTIFFSFPDFYQRNKHECLLFLSFIILFLMYYGTFTHWFGLVAWGPRYLLPIVPFMLLPLGASIEKRKNRIFKSSLVILGGLGVFFNFVYVIQDVSWFVWTFPGSHSGLFGLALPTDPLYISPSVIWKFEYSQLAYSMREALEQLQPDMFLLKLFGPQVFGIVFIAILTPLSYLLFRLLRKNQNFLIR